MQTQNAQNQALQMRNALHTQPHIAEYLAEFGRVYPGVQVKIKTAPSKKGEPKRYYVDIDGDNGGMSLTLDDIREATQNFKQGKGLKIH